MSTGPVERPRVVIAHDYLTQRGGAERVVLSLLEAFPGAPLITGMYEPASTYPEFADHRVVTLPIGNVGLFRRDPRLALVALPRAFSRATIEQLVGPVDAVVASSSGWAHGLRTTAPKLVYCHTPARWLYETDDYLAELPHFARGILRHGVLPHLRRWDVSAAATVDRYLANSTVVRERIRRAYGVDAGLLHPPVRIDPSAPQTPVPGLEPGFLLTVSRKRGYKNVKAICEAVERLPGERLVVVGDLPAGQGCVWSDRLSGRRGIPDDQMRWLYANAAALVAVSQEDFGLTPVEAYSFGTPGIVLRAGGYLDSSVEGVTGVFADAPTADAVVAAVQDFRRRRFDPDAIRRHADTFHEGTFQARLRSEVAELLAVQASSERLTLAGPAER